MTNTYQPELTYGRNVLLSSNSKATHLEGILLILKYIIQFKVAGDQLDALLSMINYLVPDTTLPANKNEYFKVSVSIVLPCSSPYRTGSI